MPLTPEEKEALRAVRADWARFQAAMNDPHILAWELDDACFWSQEAGLIVPERIAHCNRLMGHMGIVVPGASVRLAQALIASASDVELRKLEGEG